jgi:hypothetical protein
MKKIVLVSLVILCANNIFAQTWEEWFNQNSTQRKYLLQQIAAFKVYSGYLSKGYSIAINGLNTIKGFKNGDLTQHTNYFNSLVRLNPKVKRYTRVAEIIALQISIAKQSASAIKSFKRNRHFTQTEINYLQQVLNSMLADCAKNLDELFSLITDGNLQMKDDERIKAIDKLYADMQDKQQFTRSFCNSATGLSIQRSNEANELIISKKLNGLQ